MQLLFFSPTLHPLSFFNSALLFICFILQYPSTLVSCSGPCLPPWVFGFWTICTRGSSQSSTLDHNMMLFTRLEQKDRFCLWHVQKVGYFTIEACLSPEKIWQSNFAQAVSNNLSDWDFLLHGYWYTENPDLSCDGDLTQTLLGYYMTWWYNSSHISSQVLMQNISQKVPVRFRIRSW